MDLLDRLLGLDSWTTGQILQRCSVLNSAQLSHKIDAGHQTVHETLVHMIGNVRSWTDLMTGSPAAKSESPWDNLSIAELAARHEAASADFATLARGIRDANRFDERWLDVLDVPPREKSYGGAIAHVLTHNMHHRCELLHMLSRLGVTDLPEGDALSWEERLGS